MSLNLAIALALIPVGIVVLWIFFSGYRNITRAIAEADAYNAETERLRITGEQQYDEHGVPIYRPYMGVS